jgi:hypothetical protein
MIARRESDHAMLALLGGKLKQPVGRAPELERAAGLQAFTLEPDAGPGELAFDQRCALDQAGDARASFDELLPRDFVLIS